MFQYRLTQAIRTNNRAIENHPQFQHFSWTDLPRAGKPCDCRRPENATLRDDGDTAPPAGQSQVCASESFNLHRIKLILFRFIHYIWINLRQPQRISRPIFESCCGKMRCLRFPRWRGRWSLQMMSDIITLPSSCCWMVAIFLLSYLISPRIVAGEFKQHQFILKSLM